MKTPVFLTALTILIAAPIAAAKGPSPAIVAALADPARPQADKDRDAARHPAELLTFAGVRPGQVVADFIMGGGYWTRILAKAVGPKGRVYAYQPAEFIQYRAEYGTEQDAVVKDYKNVVAQRGSLRAVGFPEPLDVIITVQNWHDLHLKIAPPGTAKRIAEDLYGPLKKNGILLVVDHVGAPGTQDSLHRGDPAGTRAEIESAGFKFDGEYPLYVNSADPHTANAFDPSIRGRTDQFVYRFKKR